jgi:ATP-binding protein involved in chromosome partitioning
MLVHRKPHEKDIKSALDSITDPVTGEGLFSSGRIDGLIIAKGDVTVTLVIDPKEANEFEAIRQRAEEVLRGVKRVKSVHAILTAERSQSQPNETADASVSSPEEPQQTPQSMKQPQEAMSLQEHAKQLNLLPNVKHVIAVASGKGGVGKSTVAANLAAALKRKKLSVGILDADIYGPSQPLMYGADGVDAEVNKGRFEVIERHGVKLMSAGFLVPGKAPLVWRGPMVHKALIQMIKDTNWASAEQPLDVLIIDMPPGTGDVALTLAKHVVVAGAVVVTTPQDIALEDARKGLDMFEKLDIPVLGMAENMSQFCCPQCGHKEDIFGSGGAMAEATARNVPLLAKLSLFPDTRKCADSGTPIVLEQPHHDATSEYLELADGVLNSVLAAS